MNTINFNNKHTRNRTKKVLGFAAGYFGDNEKSLSAEWLEKYFGNRGTYLHKYLKHMVLQCTDHYYSDAKGQCKTYRVKPDGIAELKYRLKYPNEVATSFDIVAKIRAATITSRLNDSDHTTDNTLYVKSNGHIKIMTLDNARSIMKSCSRYLTDGKYMGMMIEQSYGAQLKDGAFEYKDKSNRLWHPLQSIFNKSTRQSLLHHYGYCHMYDISTCAPTLLYQYAKMLGYDPKGTKLDFYKGYLENKDLIRTYLADTCKVDKPLMKTILNGAFNGVRIGMNDRFSTFELFGGYDDPHTECRINQLIYDPYFYNLRNEIKKMWKFIKANIKNHTQVSSGLFNINIFEILNKGNNSKFDAHKKWNLYFQLERIVMSHIRKYMNMHSIQHFNEHDGWSSRSKIDITDLQKYVYDKTGFMLNIEYVLMTKDSAGYIELFDYESVDNISMENHTETVEVSDESETSTRDAHEVRSSLHSPHSSSSFSSLKDNSKDNIIYKSFPSSHSTHVVRVCSNVLSHSVLKSRPPIDHTEYTARQLRKERNRRYYEKKKMQLGGV